MITKLHACRHAGFTLVEVTLSLGIAAFCFLVILGLLPVGLNTNQASLSQTAAASIARSVVTDLRSTPLCTTAAPAAETSPVFKITVPPPQVGSPPQHTLFFAEDGTASAQDANATTTATFVPRYRLTMTFTPPTVVYPNSSARDATLVRLLVTWPALADPKVASAPTNYTGAYEIVTSLNRN